MTATDERAGRAVVVGVGDLSDLPTTVAWALTEARTRRVALRIVCAYHWAVLYPWEFTHRVYVPELEQIHQVARHLAADVARQVQETAPEVPVATVVAEGTPVDVLLAESSTAEVLVLGSRPIGSFGAAVPGATGAVVAARAHCPTVVVRGTVGPSAAVPAVVAGIDGSEGSEAVLAFAFEEADRRGVPLRAVLAWRPDPLATIVLLDAEPSLGRAHRWLAEALAGWQEKFPGVEVHTAVVHDHPVGGLVGAAEGHTLLVVGSSGRQALLARLLGSVTQGVLHSAPCPVAVVPTSGRG